MVRKILLIFCIAFVVICYGFPCVILPMGEYKYEVEGISGTKTEVTYKFGFNGKVNIKIGSESEEYHYKLKGNEVIISSDDKFDDNDSKITINNFYELDTSLVGDDAVNQFAMWTTIGIGVLALLLVVTIPKKR